MEKLTEYLQTLLSTCSNELHLEPNKIPYVVSTDGNTEVANAPLLGTQISTIIFPLIPNEAKQQLPNQDQIEFTHSHQLGNFSVLIQKSPAGFNVTIRPMLASDEEQSFQPASANAETPDSYDSSDYTSSVTPTDTANSYYYNPVSDQAAAPAENNNIFINNESSLPEIEDSFNYDSATIEEIKAEFGLEYKQDEETAPAFEMKHEVYNGPQSQVQSQVTTPESADSFTPDSYNQGFDYGSQPPSSPAQSYSGSNNSDAQTRMDALFRKMAEVGASDLHLSVSMPPMIRRDGKMMRLECGEGELDRESSKQLLNSIMPPKNIEEFEERKDTDFAYEIEDLARFRANIFMDRKGMGGVFRIIPAEILTSEQLGLSKAIMDLCSLSKGLVVVTGPTGSGKSTTLCAMVDSINRTREDHIITIEDPIEFTHENKKCLVNQREVHNHTGSFKNALRAALREDPDILLVGEMRDLETISIAIETAETGHLVFGTLHTTTAASTVDRIIDQFPADRQQQIRVMLSESLRGVIAQTLLPKKGGGRVAALEILIVTPAISNLIREGKTFQIASSMQTGKNKGMVMLNDALMELVKKDLVEPRDAYIKAVDKPAFESMLEKNGFKM